MRIGWLACASVLLAIQLGCGEAKPTNILLISLDTLRADRLSSYGAERPTPALDMLAARGTRFANAFSTSSWTLPAHASMLSGKYPGSILPDANSRLLLRETRLLSHTLGDHGYTTGAITGGLYLGESYGAPAQFDSFKLSKGRKAVTHAKAWLRENAGQPFFLFFHT